MSESEEAPAPTVPVGLRVHLAHAALQVIATDAGVDLLHIKGPAVDPALGRSLTTSTDADVLIRPQHVNRFLSALGDHGWRRVTSFASGSAFEHAATLHHGTWGAVDAHRAFPGLTDPAAFEVLWREQTTTPIARIECAVPSLTAQRLLLLLHAARNGRPATDPDVERAWTRSDAAERARIRRLAETLGAQVGLAAALGELGRYREDPSHDLWAAFSGAATGRLDEWRGRFHAAASPRDKIRVLVHSLLVNTDHLAMRLGRRPTGTEVAREFVGRVRQGAGELVRRARTRRAP